MSPFPLNDSMRVGDCWSGVPKFYWSFFFELDFVVKAPLIMMLVFRLSLSLSMVSMGMLSLSCFNFFFPVPMVFLDPRVLCEDLDLDPRSLACESY